MYRCKEKFGKQPWNQKGITLNAVGHSQNKVDDIVLQSRAAVIYTAAAERNTWTRQRVKWLGEHLKDSCLVDWLHSEVLVYQIYLFSLSKNPGKKLNKFI